MVREGLLSDEHRVAPQWESKHRDQEGKNPPSPMARLQKVPAVLCGIAPPPSSPPPPSRHHVGSVIPLVLTGVALEVSALGMVTLKMLGFVLGDGGGGGVGAKILPPKQRDPHASQRGPFTCTPRVLSG